MLPPGSFGYAQSIGRFFGIPVSVHWSLGALILGYFFHDLSRHGASYAGLALCVGLLIVLSILIHELAHAFAARRFGLHTRAIELHAFGGVAEIVGGGGAGWQAALADGVIALAGPVSNFVLYAAFTAMAPLSEVFLAAARVNLWLGLFNLVPCFPLDGGRALLSALRMKIGPVRGDRLAYNAGMVLAMPGMIYGIVTSNPMLAIVFFMAFDICRVQRMRLDASFGTAHVVHPFGNSENTSPGFFEMLRALWARSREPRPPKLRVIKGGRFEDPPDRRSGRV